MDEADKSVKLSDVARQRFRRALIDDLARRRKDIYASVPDPKDADHQAHKLAQWTTRTILDVLTPKQLSIWKEMTGEPFTGKVEFGGGRGRRVQEFWYGAILQRCHPPCARST